jgi:hypothetical protein
MMIEHIKVSQAVTKKFKLVPGLFHQRSLQKFGIGDRKCQKLKTQKNDTSQAKKKNQLRNKAYWLDPRKLRIASPDAKIYPRSLWRKIQEFQSQNQKDHE